MELELAQRQKVVQHAQPVLRHRVAALHLLGQDHVRVQVLARFPAVQPLPRELLVGAPLQPLPEVREELPPPHL